MNSTASAPINAFSAGCAPQDREGEGEVLPVFPEENHLYCGLLQQVNGLLATVEGMTVEVPPEIAAQLRPWIGRDVIFGSVAGRFRAGLQSHRRPWL